MTRRNTIAPEFTLAYNVFGQVLWRDQQFNISRWVLMPVNIFFCYAHEDETLLEKLKVHLKPLQREGLITVWYDRDINAGEEWGEEIDKHLNSAHIILLLVSPDFMNSDYCYGVELARAIERHNRGEARVIPIILRPVYWAGTPFGKLQALPKDGRPIKSRYWHVMDEAFTDITQGIRKAITSLPMKSLPLDSVTTVVNAHENIPKERVKFLEEFARMQNPIGAKPLLIVTNGIDNGKTFVIAGFKKKIGRDLKSDIFLEDIDVSRTHAVVYMDSDGDCILTDVGSSNGTRVNNKLLAKDEKHLLKMGDQIQIGQTILVFNDGYS